MSKHRWAAKSDRNQADIVFTLRSYPGVSVETGHDDIICGYQGKTYWFEIKSQDALSAKTGMVLESEVKKSQKRLRNEWRGQYNIVSSVEEIIKIIGLLV